MIVDTATQRYYLYQDAVVFDSARAACKASGFDLPIVRTKGESAALHAALGSALAAPATGSSFWGLGE
jgi:hypothetical protein